MAYLNHIVVVDIYNDEQDEVKNAVSDNGQPSPKGTIPQVNLDGADKSPLYLKSAPPCETFKDCETKNGHDKSQNPNVLLRDEINQFLNDSSLSGYSNGLSNGYSDVEGDSFGVKDSDFLSTLFGSNDVDAFAKSPHTDRKGLATALKRPSDPPPSPPVKSRGNSLLPSKKEFEFNPAFVNPSPLMLNAWDSRITVTNPITFPDACAVDDLMFLGPFSHMDAIPEEEDTTVLESDTDDTGSSVSTVIGRFSRASTANSSFSEHCKSQSKPILDFDLEKVLSPFERLERELDEASTDLMVFPPESSDNSSTMEDIAKMECNLQGENGDKSYLDSMPMEPPECFQDNAKGASSSAENHPPELLSSKEHSNVLMRLDQVIASKKPSEDRTTVANGGPFAWKYENDSCFLNVINWNDPSFFEEDVFEMEEGKESSILPPPPIPPRRGNHIPVRRTRSDPGHDSATPSRIPRPTFLTRSSTFAERSHIPYGNRTVATSNARVIKEPARVQRDQKQPETNPDVITQGVDITAQDSIDGPIERYTEVSNVSPFPEDVCDSKHLDCDIEDSSLIPKSTSSVLRHAPVDTDSFCVEKDAQNEAVSPSEEAIRPPSINTTYILKNEAEPQCLTLPSLHGPSESSVNSIKSVAALSFAMSEAKQPQPSINMTSVERTVDQEKHTNESDGQTAEIVSPEVNNYTRSSLEDCPPASEGITTEYCCSPSQSTETQPDRNLEKDSDEPTEIIALYESLVKSADCCDANSSSTNEICEVEDIDKGSVDPGLVEETPAFVPDIKSPLISFSDNSETTVSQNATPPVPNPERQYEPSDVTSQKGVAMEIMHYLTHDATAISESTSLPSFPRQPPDGHEFPQNYSEPSVSLYSLSELKNPTAESIEKNSATSEDSGVFLEDGPFVHELSATSMRFTDCSPKPEVDPPKPAERLSLKNASSCNSDGFEVPVDDMRQYTIKQQTLLESDGESRSDAGITSASTDSADELDVVHIPPDTLPPPPPPKSAPPSAPLSKQLSNSMRRYSEATIETTNGKDLSFQRADASYILQRKGSLYDDTTVSSDVQKNESLLSNRSNLFKKEASKWKSEECLRLNTERKWSFLSSRHKEKPVSVKDRIAMFSWKESENPVQSPGAKCHNSFRNDSHVKHAFSTDTLNDKSEVCVSKNSFQSLAKDNKWLSMDNVSSLSPTDRHDQKTHSLVDKSPSLKNNDRTKSEDQRRKEKDGVSNYPQTQLSRYGFGTFPSNYRRNEDSDKRNGTGILPLGETRKSTKLKGLVIPNKPSPLPGAPKALPTIVSADSIVPSKPEVSLSQSNSSQYKPNSTPSSRRKEQSSKKTYNDGTMSDREGDAQKQPLLSEPPWKSERNTLPKYSPAFKSRTLELPHGVASSLSPTPPSSLTSPLSPPPSSPSSGCSSTASSSSTATKQGIFQFSLSHSKPVTPLLPEKPIMSPPSLPSDVEYEGDNSEDSTIPSSSPPLIMAKGSTNSLGQSFGKQETRKMEGVEIQAPVSSPITAFVVTSSAVRLCNGDSTEKTMQKQNITPYSESSKNGFVHSEPKFTSRLTNGVSNSRSSSFHAVNGNAIQRLDSLISSGSNESATSDKGTASASRIGERAQEPVGRFHAQPVCVGIDDTNSDTPVVNGRGRDPCDNKNVASSLNGQPVSNNKGIETKNFNVEGGPKVNGYYDGRQRWPQTGFDTAESEDDDSHSSLSQQTEDSRNTIEDSLSDATSDSCEKSADPDLKPRRLSQQRTVLRNGFDSTDSVRNFRALAEKWQQRAEDSRDVISPTPPPPPVCPPVSANNTIAPRKDSNRHPVQESNVKLPPSLMPRHSDIRIPERKTSVPSMSYSNSPTNNMVKTRSRSSLTRPSSFIEDKQNLENLWNGSSMDYPRKTSIKESLDINNSLRKSQAFYQSASRDSLDTLGPRARPSFLSNNKKSVSVSDIRKAFESQTQQAQPPQVKPGVNNRRSSEDIDSPLPLRNSRSHSMLLSADHRRISSIDSTASESDLGTPVRYGSVGSLNSSVFRDQYGSMTSLASTTSLISPQELQQLIDEANQSLEEAGTPTHEIIVVVFHKEMASGGIGITLAGGADYEVKEISVHKVISGSLADRDGRIRKGDRVISINGRNLKGITHREALDILKAPRPEVVLVVSRERQDVTCNGNNTTGRKSSLPEEITDGFHVKENIRRKEDHKPNAATTLAAQGPMVRVELNKDSTGLGFNIEGGKDSPTGDRPLAIKRLFKSGVADRDGQLEVGDEILSVNGQPVTSMTRTEAWNFFKKLPEGVVVLMIRKTTP